MFEITKKLFISIIPFYLLILGLYFLLPNDKYSTLLFFFNVSNIFFILGALIYTKFKHDIIKFILFSYVIAIVPVTLISLLIGMGFLKGGSLDAFVNSLKFIFETWLIFFIMSGGYSYFLGVLTTYIHNRFKNTHTYIFYYVGIPIILLIFSFLMYNITIKPIQQRQEIEERKTQDMIKIKRDIAHDELATPTSCEEMYSNSVSVGICQYRIAIYKQDYTLCKKIRNSDIKNKCFAATEFCKNKQFLKNHKNECGINGLFNIEFSDWENNIFHNEHINCSNIKDYLIRKECNDI